jgi:prepilin-type processing-associated H-X9-DG protein/prepilin-type N-terminal cleavage/methylation domain-containing protein
MPKIKVSPGVTAHRRSLLTGFTLVELLVVIGIIALLIGILLPALTKARQASIRTACAAKLHSIMIAAASHAVEHGGYYPLVGELNAIGAGQMTPSGLDDTYTQRYTYFSYTGLASLNNNDIRILAPIHFALGVQMGFRNVLSADTDAKQAAVETDKQGVMRNFLCPGQAAEVNDLRVASWFYAGTFGNYYGGYLDTMSYDFNEAVLGYDDTYHRLQGKASLIRQPAMTMFACDGNPCDPYGRPADSWSAFNSPPPGINQGPYGTPSFFNQSLYAPITMGDILAGNKDPKTHTVMGGSPMCFDRIRHQGKMNIAFCDGHVEVYTIPVITSDPTARGLAKCYILAP